MDTLEIETQISPNQISFDFEGGDLKEESLLFTETLIKPLNHEYIKDEVLFVVVRVQNKLLAKDLPSLKICGKKMVDWVLLAGSCCEEIVIEDCEDIINRVRSINTDKKYIALFYSDTPLLDKATFFMIMDYFASRSMNFLQLTRGFVVKTDFLKNNPNFITSSAGGNDIADLLICDCANNLVKTQETLNERITNYHIKNGVTIFGRNTVFIDADVEIDSGVVIYPNNILKGECIISAGTIIESGNIIENSIVLNDCEIKGSYIKDSKITQGKKIDYGNKIVKEVW